jgi:hypothetical protein
MLASLGCRPNPRCASSRQKSFLSPKFYTKLDQKLVDTAFKAYYTKYIKQRNIDMHINDIIKELFENSTETSFPRDGKTVGLSPNNILAFAVAVAAAGIFDKNK